MIGLVLAGIASAILSTLGTVGGTLIQGEYNKEQAQAQRDFEERMSNTSIQRQITDAQKAGISPSLVLGSGATTPMGTSAQIGAPDLGKAMTASTSQLLQYIEKRDQLDTLKEINEDKIQGYNENTAIRAEAYRDRTQSQFDAQLLRSDAINNGLAYRK